MKGHSLDSIDNPMCICGDTAEMHIDGMEQCAVVDCGCREFEDKLEAKNDNYGI